MWCGVGNMTKFHAFCVCVWLTLFVNIVVFRDIEMLRVKDVR